MLMSPRSFLFVPGNRVERFEKALNSGSDAVIIDLEDAVPIELKIQARQMLREWLIANEHKEVIVRVNSRQTEWFTKDIELSTFVNVIGIVLPKTESPEDIQAAYEIAEAPIYPIIETPVGLANAREIALAKGVKALMFGSIDFQLEMDMQGGYEELLYFRSELVLASKLAHIESPVDGVTTDFKNNELLKLETEQAKRLGFQGKLCIHPNQVIIVNQVLMPTEDDIVWAKRVLEVVNQSKGQAVSLDGKMVDKPVISKANKILTKAGFNKNN